MYKYVRADWKRFRTRSRGGTIRLLCDTLRNAISSYYYARREVRMKVDGRREIYAQTTRGR